MASQKQSKKSRSHESRAAKAKAGVKKGEKLAWGDPLDDQKWENDKPYLDKNDPNYPGDDEEDEEIVYQTLVMSESVKESARLSNEELSKFKGELRKAITVIYENKDKAADFIQFVKTGSASFRHVVVAELVASTYGKKDDARKLVMGLLVALYNNQLVNESHLEGGFSLLFSTCLEEGDDAIQGLEAMVALCSQEQMLSEVSLDEFASIKRPLKSKEKLKKMKAEIDSLFREYFTSGSYDQCAQSISGLNAPFHYEIVHYEVVKRGIRIALDKDQKSRELMSRFLAYSTGTGQGAVLQSNAVARGFEIMLQNVESLYVDVPDCLYLLSCFIARGIVDEVLPPAFLTSSNIQEGDMGAKVLTHVGKVLKEKNSYEQLAKVWVSGQDKSVPELKKTIREHIREYFISEELDDTIGNLKALNVPYFDHEIVKQLILLTCDFKDKQVKLAQNLLKVCAEQQLISERMIQLGFSKVAMNAGLYLPDIPNLPKVYSKLRDAVLQSESTVEIIEIPPKPQS